MPLQQLVSVAARTKTSPARFTDGYGTAHAIAGAMDLLAATPLKQGAPAALRRQDDLRPAEPTQATATEPKAGFASDLALEEAGLAAATSAANEPSAVAEPAPAEPAAASEPGTMAATLEAAGIAAMNAFIFPTLEVQVPQSLETAALVDGMDALPVSPTANAAPLAADTTVAPLAAPAPTAVTNRTTGLARPASTSAVPVEAATSEKAPAATTEATVPATQPAPQTNAAPDAAEALQVDVSEVRATTTNTLPAAVAASVAPEFAANSATAVDNATSVLNTATPRKTPRPAEARQSTNNASLAAPFGAETATFADEGSALLPVAETVAPALKDDVQVHDDKPDTAPLAAEGGTLASISGTPARTPAHVTPALAGPSLAAPLNTTISIGGNEPQRALTPAERQFAVEEVRMHLAEARPEVSIILDPPALGEVHVHLMVQQGAVKAEIRAEHADVADSLRAELATLRSALEEAGLTVADVQVKTRDDGRLQNSAQHDLQREQRQGMATNREKDADARFNATQDAPTRRSTTARTARTNTAGANALDVTI